MIREGCKVAYVGHPGEVAIGDVGKVLSDQGNASHIQWLTGASKGRITGPWAHADLVEQQSTTASIDDSLDDGTLVTVAVREVYDDSGDLGLLAALNEAGHLATFTELADEAMLVVAHHIRRDPAFSAVLSALDTDEADRLVGLTASYLMRDAFGEDHQ